MQGRNSISMSGAMNGINDLDVIVYTSGALNGLIYALKFW